MSAFTDFAEAKILDSWFRTLAAYKPAAIYFALFTAAPSDTGGGTEVTGGSYARVQVTQADANWNAPGAAGLIDNVAAISFATATVNWGTVVAVGIFDASTVGNLLMWSLLVANKTVNSGDTFRFNIGDMDIVVA